LLKDLSDSELEAPTEDREEAIQKGVHYAESLPIEFQPSAEYMELFHLALRGSAGRIAYATGVVTEQVLQARGTSPVLVSLARAGTPIGILMRRWALSRGLDLPHYTMSIVRGRGMDHEALRYLARHHDPADVIFVDGWTGKGAITRELALSVQVANAALRTAYSPQLAVLADPGACVDLFGTREDFLVASACLNSTVSGLVSRTVLNDDLIGKGDFHGAKFYDHLRDRDVSRLFIETVVAHFPSVARQVETDLPRLLNADRMPTWAGSREVDRVAREYGIGDLNLVKPGVGETTRVLLRRVPWKILIRPDRDAELEHVLHLAVQRGVPVDEVGDLAFSCIGLIHPQFTRGATGADGVAIGCGHPDG
jgi:hypothetical protein